MKGNKKELEKNGINKMNKMKGKERKKEKELRGQESERQ